MWKRDNYGNAIKLAFMTKFQGGIETNDRNAMQSANMMKFRCGKETVVEMQ